MQIKKSSTSKIIMKSVFFTLLFIFLLYDLVIQYLPKVNYVYIKENMVFTIISDLDYNQEEIYYVADGKYDNIKNMISKNEYYLLNKYSNPDNSNYIEINVNNKGFIMLFTNMSITNYNKFNNKFIIQQDNEINDWGNYNKEEFKFCKSIDMMALRKRMNLYD